MNSQVESRHYTPSETHDLFVIDLTSSHRVQVTLGLAMLAIGFVVMSYPLIDKQWLYSSLALLFAASGLVLFSMMAMTAKFASNLAVSIGFKRYSILVVHLIVASLTVTTFPEYTLSYLAGICLLYFFLDESLLLINTVSLKQRSAAAIKAVDLCITLVAVLMLITNFELMGEPVVSLLLSFKLIFFGMETAFAMRSEHEEI